MSTLTIDGHRHATTVSSDYLRLVARLPLRPIRSTAEYERAADVIDKLSVKSDLSGGEQDDLSALCIFVEAYDEADPELNAKIDPIIMLKSLMEHRGMAAKDLGELLGSKGAASEILHGKRGISKTRMAKLAAHFRVDAGVFL